MSNRYVSKGDNPALSLYQLIGAPLHALVDAESQAAMATRDFIRDVGFLKGEGPAGEEYGDLRMVRFKTERHGPDGRKSMEVQVPLLSMLPIPALQVKDAELEFFVKIIDTVDHRSDFATSGKPTATPAEEPAGAGGQPPMPKLDAERLDFRASLSRRPPDSSRSSMEMQIRIKIRVEQADIPAGMARLFNLLEQNVSAREIADKREE